MAVVLKSNLALRDLDEIFDYIAEDSPHHASHYLREMERTLHLLAETPLIGIVRPDLAPQLRSFVYARHVLFYRVISGGIELVRVLHGARDIAQEYFL